MSDKESPKDQGTVYFADFLVIKDKESGEKLHENRG